MTGMLEEYCCRVGKTLANRKLSYLVGIDAFHSHFLLLVLSHAPVARFRTIVRK